MSFSFGGQLKHKNTLFYYYICSNEIEISDWLRNLVLEFADPKMMVTVSVLTLTFDLWLLLQEQLTHVTDTESLKKLELSLKPLELQDCLNAFVKR